MFAKRGAAVLEPPEQNHAPEFGSPRRVSGSPRRKLRHDFAEGYAGAFEEDGDTPVERRRAGSSGLRLRYRDLPRTTWGKLVAGTAFTLCLGLCFGVLWLGRNVLLHNDRFYILSSSSIDFAGNAHVTRAQLMSIFGGDIERNIFSVSLPQRQAELEQLPWVAHATVMRLLPNRLRVSVVERTPVAFVRQGSHIGLVDAAGVLLDMPPDAKGDAHYSFPVVSGISADDPLSTRAARMKIFGRFAADLDSSGQKISEELSEVDLSNPEDVKALIPDHSSDILVHFGDTDFLDRYRRFEEHLTEWRTVYPKLSSVDMRYERQVVLEMQPGSAVPVSGTGGATDDSKTATAVGAGAQVANKSPVGPPARPRSVPGRHPAVLKTKAAQKAPARGKAPGSVKARSEAAFSVSAKAGRTKAKTHAAAAKHNARVAEAGVGTPRYYPPRAVHP